MIVLNKVFYFSAAHSYGNPQFSTEQNLAAFGKDLHVHGHNYTLTVSVTGEVDPQTGFLIDLRQLKQLVQRTILDQVDHALIDQDLPWFQERQPSTENMVVWMWEQLSAGLAKGVLHRIRLQETPTIYTDYYGPH